MATKLKLILICARPWGWRLQNGTPAFVSPHCPETGSARGLCSPAFLASSVSLPHRARAGVEPPAPVWGPSVSTAETRFR